MHTVQYIPMCIRMYEVSCIYSRTYMYVLYCAELYCTVCTTYTCAHVCVYQLGLKQATHTSTFSIDMCCVCVQENIKSLIGYISEKHLSGLEGVHYVCTFQALKMKHLEELDHQGAAGGASSDTS